MSIITIATGKGGAGKTLIARLILGRLAISGFTVTAIDTDPNRTLSDWVATAAKQPITIRHELDETRIVPLAAELTETHDALVIDTARRPSRVPIAPSSADVVEAIKTRNLVKSAALLLRKEVPARVILNSVQTGTNVSEHVEKEVAKAGLPPLPTRLHRLVAYQELSFTGIVPVTGRLAINPQASLMM